VESYCSPLLIKLMTPLWKSDDPGVLCGWLRPCIQSSEATEL
jgi:hypothetical protein